MDNLLFKYIRCYKNQNQYIPQKYKNKCKKICELLKNKRTFLNLLIENSSMVPISKVHGPITSVNMSFSINNI